MQLKSKIYALTFTIMLTLTIIGRVTFTPSTNASTETIIKVEPTLIEFGNSTGNPISIPGTQFNVTIKIYNVTNLYGFDLKFKWNTTFLRYINHFVYVPKDTYPDGILWNSILLLEDEVNASAGTYWIAYASMRPAPSFNGSGKVFTMTFEIINQPYDYETGGPEVDPINVTLGFLSTDLADFEANPISHVTEEATFRLWEKLSYQPPYPVLKVMPTKVENLPAFSTFNIDIWILNINQSYGIANLSITMNFNSTLIKAEEIIEGSWLENYAENFTTILNQIDNTAGKATYSIELGPKKPNPPTAGIIVTLIFYVINESTTYPPSSCELTLSPTEIFDRNIGLIPHTTENSTFIAYTPPPSAKFTWTPLGNILPRGQTITFNASESYLPLGIKSYIWDFGDGNTTTVRNSSITHVYQSTGTVTVILNITDEENFWAVANATLHILDEPQTPPTISVVNLQTGNGNFTFYTNITSVSSSFNVTIKLYNVADLQTYQIHLEYNSTILNCTRAWIPTWDTTWVFYGKATIAPQLIFGLGYIRIADSIERTYSTFSGTGILCIIEFRIIYAPAAGETFCSLNIDNANTFLLDSNWNEISSIKTNGNYIYVHQTVKVEAQPAPITQYIVGGTAAIVIIVVIGAYLMKIRKRK